jgi:hypothetical protein
VRISPPLARAARLVFAAAAVAFLILAFVQTYDRARDVMPAWWRVGLSAVCALAGLAFAGRSWLALFDDAEPRGPLLRAFYGAQIAKYVPGGVWQAVGQIGLTARAGIAVERASTAFVVNALTNVAAGATVGSLVAFAGPTPKLPVRLLSLAGLSALLLLHRGWMTRAVAVARRVARRPAGPDVVPGQAAILRSYAWCLGTFVAAGAAFGFVLADAPAGWSALTPVAAFGLAWTAGFLALPFPSGLGVREAVLIVTAGSSAAAPVIAASAIHRLVTIVAEALWILGTRAGVRRGADR